MRQVWIIHGGDSFTSHDAYISDLKSRPLDLSRLSPSKKWRDWLADNLPDAEVLRPSMPNADNAHYEEWKIYFEKMLPHFSDDVTLIGNSLGAMFLAKYLHDNQLPAKLERLILVAAQYGKRGTEGIGDFVVEDASGLERSAKEIHLFYSEDDPIVTYDSLEAFQSDIRGAVAHTFPNRGHFLQDTFPEILELLKQK